MKTGARNGWHVALALVFLGAVPRPPAARDEIVRFQGEVSLDHDFRKPIGHGLVLIINSRIAVAPQTVTDPACANVDDFAWVVNLPVHGYNSLALAPSYGMTAANVAEDSPRQFNFVLNCAGYQRELTFVRRASEKQGAGARAKLGTSPQGHGKLWIEKYKVSAAPESAGGKNYGQIDWMRFRVEIRIPENADSMTVPGDYDVGARSPAP